VPATSGYTYKWFNDFGVISGAITTGYNATSSGNYHLEITNASGCLVTTSPISVSVKSMPNQPTITASNYQVGQCPFESKIKLSTLNLAGYKYQWFRNGTSYPNGSTYTIEDYLPQSEYLQSGDYTVEADLNGCKSVSPIFNVSFAVAPEKPTILVKGPVVWYMATSKKTYKNYRWYLNDELIQGANKYIYVANKKLGTYRVEVADDLCYTSSDKKTIPLAKSAMTDFSIPAEYIIGDEIDAFEYLKIYPNPTPGLFTIEMDNNILGELNISIVTQAGKEILNIKFEKTTEHFSSQIDLSGQPQGMYLINLLIDKYFATRKLIVE
jgi:hypothetical protein